MTATLLGAGTWLAIPLLTTAGVNTIRVQTRPPDYGLKSLETRVSVWLSFVTLSLPQGMEKEEKGGGLRALGFAFLRRIPIKT